MLVRTEQVLPDLLRDDLDIVFCGTQAGTASARKRAYYAGPGNRFWTTLYDTGLIPLRLRPEDYRRLLEFRIGLTDVAKRTHGPDAVLRRDHFNVEGFRAKTERHRPRVIAFNGKKAASAAMGLATGSLRYGIQSVTIGTSAVVVLPSTSGAANGFWDIGPWQALSAYVRGTE